MTTYRVIVTINKSDGSCEFRTWTGTNPKEIHKTARKYYKGIYPGCVVDFGNAVGVNSYGAH